MAEFYRYTGSSWVSPGRPPIGAVPNTGRPTGPNYVRYEDAYVSGDNLQDTLNRVTGNRVLTFPEGEFLIPNNFSYGYLNGVRIGSGGATACRGIAGSGRNTIFSMASSNQPKWTTTAGACPYMLISAAGGPGASISAEFRNFTLKGTDLGQGNEYPYNGLRLEYCTDSLIENVYIHGVTGTMNYPPGETGSINFYKCFGSSGTPSLRIKNVEIDGRRDGVRVSSSPIMANDSTWVQVDDCYIHHARCGGGGIAWWWCSDCTITNTRSEYIGTGTGTQAGYCFNHEQCDRIAYNDCTTLCGRGTTGNSPSSLHMSMNSDKASRPGMTAPSGLLTVNNPTWDATAIGGGQFCVETWDLGSNNAQFTAPVVNGADGNPIPYTWINGND